MDSTIVTALIVAISGIIGAAISAYVTIKSKDIEAKSKDIEAKKDPIYKIDTRTGYLDTVINNIDSAQGIIYLCIHTLNPSKNNPKIEELQDKLERAKSIGKIVKILVPCSRERIEAAFEIAKVRNLDIKFSKYDTDFRFTLIGDDISIMSVQDKANESSKGVIIRSSRLYMILKDYFEKQWDRDESKTYEMCVKNIIQGFNDPSQPLSNAIIAEKLNLPNSEIDRIDRIIG